MLDNNEKLELRDYFDTFNSEEMEEVIQLIKELTEVKRQAEYEDDLCKIVAQLDHFIDKYEYLDFNFDGFTMGIGSSAILSVNALKSNTICIRHLNEQEKE